MTNRFDDQNQTDVLKGDDAQYIGREGNNSQSYSGTSEYSSEMAYDNKSVEGLEGILRNEKLQDNVPEDRDAWNQDSSSLIIASDR